MGLHARLAAGIVRRPKLVLAVGALVAVASAILLGRFRVDPDIQSLFPTGDPTLRLTRSLQGDTPPSRSLFVVLRAESASKLEEAVPGIAERLRASPLLAKVVATREEFAGARVDWVKQAPLYSLPEETLDRLKARLAGPERRAELESCKRRLAEDPLGGKEAVLRDPLGLRWIFDEAGDRMSSRFPFKLRPGSPWLVIDDPPVAFLRAVGRKESFDIAFSKELLDDVRARLAGAPVAVELAGGYVSAMHHAGAMRKDLILQSVLSGVFVLAFLAWFTRSLVVPAFLLAPLALAIAAGLAFGGAILGPLTPLAVTSAAILVAQGIDFPVHFFSRFREERRTRPREEAIVASQGSLGRPFLGAAATTMAAFGALLLSHFPGFRQFGFLLFVSFALCLVAAMTLFPALLLFADRFVRPGRETTPWLVRFGARRPRPAIAALLVLAGLAAWTVLPMGKIRIDLDLRNSMAPDDPGLEVLRRLERDLGVSMNPVFALVDAAMPLEELRARTAPLRSDGPHALVPSDESRRRVERFLKETEGWIEGAAKELTAIGFKPDPFRKGLEGFQKVFAAPPPAIASLSQEPYAALRRQMTYEDEEGRKRWVVTLFPKASLWEPGDRAAFDADVRKTLPAEFYSAFHLPDHYSRVLMGDLGRVACVTVAAVVLLTLLSVGGLKDGLLALVPAFIATGATLGTLVLLGSAINLMNMVAVPIILGIGVDGGIHYMARLRDLPGRDPACALRDVGPGVWGSAITTLLGFGSIAGSVTPGLQVMGILVSVGTVASLLSVHFVLPALVGKPSSSKGV